MTPAETTSILSYFTAAWPWAEVAEGTAVVWADALTGVTAQDAHTAARQLAKSDDRPPSLARFLQACRGIATGREADETRQLGPGTRSTAAEAADRMRRIRVGWAAEQANRPAHDHKRAVCPKCSTAAAFIAATAPEILAAVLHP